MKNSINFFIVTFFLFSANAVSAPGLDPTTDRADSKKRCGKVILVSGSCSSGKSSMARIIAQKLNAKSYAFDDYVMPQVLKGFIKKHYGSVLAFFISGFVMRNFFTAVSFLSEKRKHDFQQKFYNDLENGLAFEPASRMYREIKRVALSGCDVVVEAPMFLGERVDCLAPMAELDGLEVTYVLAYCPWNDLVDRIQRRNSCKNKKVHRELDWALINFMQSLDISTEKNDKPCLECLNAENVHKVISEYSQKKYKKKHLKLDPQTQETALHKFPQNADYYIYPRFDYNITVNTKTNNPDQGAALVLKYLGHVSQKQS